MFQIGSVLERVIFAVSGPFCLVDGAAIEVLQSSHDTRPNDANKPGCHLPVWSARLAIQDSEEDAAPAPHYFPLVCFRPSFVLLVER